MRSDPRHVYVLSFDTANTDLKYFCSHPDQVLDGVSAANIFYGDIINASTYSQRLNPIRANAEIGGIDFTFLDTSGALSALMNAKALSGYGLRAKRVQHWVGEKGAEWSSGYDLIQTQQIHDSIRITNDGLGYQFSGRDIQRSELENIFDPKITTLSASATKTAIAIDVNSTTGIDLIQHGPSYSDAPNEKVLYFKIKDEIIRGTAKTATSFTVDNAQSTLNGTLSKDAVSIVVTDASEFNAAGVGYLIDGSVHTEIKWTGKSSNTLTGVTGVTVAHASGKTIVASNGRGALGTVPEAYTFDSGSTSRTKVTEHIYYELPGIKLAYAILTGTLYGSADTIPEHHHLGISTDWISTSEFTQFPDDVWDTSDDTKGRILRFSGLKKTNAKKFIEEEINFWCGGMFNPVLNTGELGLRKMTGVISDAAHTGILNADNILSISGARFDLNDVHNNVAIDWNHDPVLDDYTRHTSIADTDSQATWGASKTLELKSKGLHGSRDTDNVLRSLFNTWRDRHVWPPFKATLALDYSQRKIKVGEIKRLQLSHIPEFTDADGEYSGFDAAVEVQRVALNPQAGTVTVDVFGSTSKATPLLLGRTDAAPLADAWFTSEGSDISGVGTITGSGTPIYTITGGSLVGADDLSSATATTDNDTGIFYWDGDLNINGQVDITKNVELRVNGFVTFNSAGVINGKGAGLAGGITGLAGAIGNSQAGGGFYYNSGLRQATIYGPSTEQALIEGENAKVPPYILTNNFGTTLSGKPTNLMGSSGGKGGNVTGKYALGGGAGGNGGAGLVIYCKGASGVPGSSIDLSGNDGSKGAAQISDERHVSLYSGSGAGGQSGAFSLFLVGITVTETLSDYFVANNGATPIFGEPLAHAGKVDAGSVPLNVYSHYTGIGSQNVSRSNLFVDWVPDNLTATADAAPLAETATLISFTENSNTPQTPAENLATIDVTITPPSDTSYSHSMIAYKVATDDDTQFQRLPYPAKNETTVVLPMDGTEYTFRAYPVNIDGVESTDYIKRNFTISASVGYIGSLANEIYLKYESGALELGSNTQLIGASAIKNTSYYWDWSGDSIDGFVQTTAGSGAISFSGGVLAISVQSGASDSSLLEKKLIDLDAIKSWDVDRAMRGFISLTNVGTNHGFELTCGLGYLSNGEGFGFYSDASYDIQAWVGNGATKTTFDTGINLPSGTDFYDFYVEYKAGVNVKFYINDSLVATISATMPSGTGNADRPLFFKLFNHSAGIQYLNSIVYDLRFLHKS